MDQLPIKALILVGTAPTMNNNSTSATTPRWNDPFCETQFWNNADGHMWIAQPFATATAIVMMIMALRSNRANDDDNDNAYDDEGLPLMFRLCKGALLLVGLSTLIYHGMNSSTMASAHLNACT